MLQNERPPGIDCADWIGMADSPNKKQCRHYGHGGSCALDQGGKRPICTEFLKRNPMVRLTNDPSRPASAAGAEPKSPAGPPGGAQTADQVRPRSPDLGRASGARSGQGFDPRESPTERSDAPPPFALKLAPPTARPARAPGGSGVDADFRSTLSQVVPSKTLEEEAEEATRSLASRYRVELEAMAGVLEDGARLVLVEKYSAATPREEVEVTFKDAAVLAMVLSAFPGAKVVRLRGR